MEPQTRCHVIDKEKVAKQIIVTTVTAVLFELQWIYSTVRISK